MNPRMPPARQDHVSIESVGVRRHEHVGKVVAGSPQLHVGGDRGVRVEGVGSTFHQAVEGRREIGDRVDAATRSVSGIVARFLQEEDVGL
jgi:hypothetical protein